MIKTYWKLPLGLPQRLDPVVMRHARFKCLLAHDPLPTRTRTPVPRGGVTCLAAHDDDDEKPQKKYNKKGDVRHKGLDHPHNLLLGEKGDAVLGTRVHGRDRGSAASGRCGGRGGLADSGGFLCEQEVGRKRSREKIKLTATGAEQCARGRWKRGDPRRPFWAETRGSSTLL